MVSLEVQPLRSSFGKVFMGAAGTPTGASDDQFNRVSFLSHFEGSNNGVNNAFDDSSASNHTISVNGNVTQGSFGPFARPDGEFSVSFDGGDDDYLSLSPQADFAFGTGDFSVSLWVFFNNVGTYDYLIDGRNSDQTSSTWSLSINYTDGASGKLMFASGSSAILTSDTDFVVGQWYYISVSRSGTTSRMHFNGTQVAINTSDSTNYSTSPNTSYIGTRYSTEHSLDGILSNVRVVKGTALSDYTPPTAPLTAVTNTKLLTCQSNRFVDNSASAHTITPTGNPAVSAFGPFLTSSVYDPAVNGASAYLDGNGDYLSIANSSDFNLAANDFCFEFWFWCDSLAQYDTILSLYNTWAIEQESSGGGIKIAMWISSGSSGDWNLLSAGIMSNLLKVNEWNHLVIARTGNTLKSYHNGAIVYNSSFNATIGSSSNILYSGTFDTSAYYWDGYISDVKLSNGSTGGINVSGNTITVPTAPLAVTDSNTKLLLNMADGQAIDSAAQTNLTLFGNAKISTGQAKFGDTSLLLDGTGDFLHLHNRRDLSGPFCIEAFARADDTGTAFLWCLGQYRLELGISEAKLRIYRVGTATAYTDFFTGGEFTVNNWHHVALVRDTSNVIKCYLNGTASGTTVTDATAFVATDNILIIGGEADGTPSGGSINHGWDGYVDDFRISDFARYTSNFTAPSEPFADKGQ